MKKFLLPVICLLTSLVTAQAQFFTNGNLAVVRISGNDQTTGDGAAVYIDQYTTNGTLVSSFAVPSSGNNALIMSGYAYEGFLTLTPDGTHLVFAGYNAAAPYASELVQTTSAAVPRIAATLDGYGVYTVAITNMTNFSGSSGTNAVITSATSDGTNFWMAGTGPTGNNGGLNQVAYVGTASQGATNQVCTNLFSGGMHAINIYNGGLYACGYTSNTTVTTTAYGSGGYLLSNINGALPTNGTVFTNAFAGGTSSAGTASDLVINPAGTIAYLADDSFGIIKYTNSASGWVSNYTIVLSNSAFNTAGGKEAISVTADWTQTPPVLYATTSETFTNRLVTLQDTNANGVDTIVTLAQGSIVSGAGGATNTFRGVRFVPVSKYPYISVPPVSFTGAPGQTATFTATVLGVPTLTYQWYSNSVGNPTFVAIPGATSTNLSLTNVSTSQNGSQLYLVASNAYGIYQSAAITLTVLNPAITSEPVGATNFPGTGPVSLCVTAVGTGTLTYQWRSNGVAISGATSACYTAPSSAASNTTIYTVIVSNSLNESITSTPTVISFTPYLLYDTFTYPNGLLFGDLGSPWTEESGTTPIDVTNDRVIINQNIGSLGTAFGQSLYTQPQSNQVLWASFIVNLTNLPATAAGTYFAYFQSTNFNFYGRIIALTSNNPSYTPDISPVAYPGTYRLGIANNQTAASAVVELDMSPGIDYQVVAYYDMVNGFCQLAVNPSPTNYSQVYAPFAAPSSLASAITSDTFTPAALPMAAYGLREAANGGVLLLHNLEVSYDWNGAGTGFTAVTAGIAPTVPVVGFLSPGITNYAGNSNTIEVAASGIGVSYAWYQNGTKLSDGNSVLGSATPLLTFNPLVGTNSGSYTVVVSNSAGSVTSAVVVVSVNSTPTAPIFTLQPVSVTSSLGANVTFTATAVGTGPITYQWNTDGSPNGSTGSSFTLTKVTTNLSGNSYSVTATGGTSLSTTSSNAVLTVNGPISTNIAFLRSLLITSAAPTITIAASNSTPVYQVTGVVTEFTNIETATYAEYWIQDSTAGIEFFVTDPTFRPQLGDVVSVTGVVDIFDDAAELDGSANNPAEPYTVVSTNGEGSPLPYAPLVLPWGLPQTNPALSAVKYQGSLCVITNAYFVTPGTLFASSANVEMTNKAGYIYYLYTGGSSGPDLIGQPIPTFAYSITSPYDQFETTEFELQVTAGIDIVTNPPPPVTNLTAKISAGSISLKWTAIPAIYTYSVWSSTNLTGPWSQASGGLWFSNSSGAYTSPILTNQAMFFRIDSP